MSMMRFGLLFPDVAEREMRTVQVLEALPEADPSYVPVDEYGLDELYCDERRCDCRRVMINILARHAKQHVATINHAFQKPGKDAPVSEQTFLDPLNLQSRWAAGLLRLFMKVVLADQEYRQRWLRHYRMFKNVVDDPTHPAHRLLRRPSLNISTAPALQASSRILPPPGRKGRRKRWR
jgi:hypothetical protein